MPYQDLQGLGMKGLNTDTQAQAIDHTQFSAGNNMRPFDGALQTVFAFGGVEGNITPATMAGDDDFESRLDVTALSGWIETGANELRIAYIWNDGDTGNNAMPYHLQVINDLSTDGNFIEGADAVTMLTDNPRWGQQLLAFNGILLVNDSVQQPIIVFDNFEATLADAPEWDTDITYDLNAYVTTGTGDELKLWRSLAGSNQGNNPLTATDSWVEATEVYAAQYILGWLSAFDEDDINSDDNRLNQAPENRRVTCERLIAYNNRLIALNIQGDYLEAALGNSTIVFSTPITELNSLNGVTFRFTQFNSAGDDILTETPGEIVDGGVLGEYLIIYKDDAVYRYQDVGDPLFLIGEVQFSDDGLYSPDCFVDIGGSRHVVLGNYGVYIHQGGPQKQNISRNRVQTNLYSDIIPNSKDDAFLFHNENDKEVWVCIPAVVDTWEMGAAYDDGDVVKFAGSAYRASMDIADSMSTPAVDDAWDELEVDGCNKAYVYNYEYDAWYTRDLPIVDNGENQLIGTRGITSFQKDGELWVLAFGKEGVRRLDDERRFGGLYASESSVEMHYMDFGDPSKVKYVMAAYPHTMDDVEVSIEASNKLGASNTPTFPDSMAFDSDEEYKQDWRIHGRYYHIKVANMPNTSDDPDVIATGGTNPELTGLGIEVKLGGDR